MANELVYLDATAKTVTCTVSEGGGAISTPSVTESTGVYRADFSSATKGYVYILWNNTTDVALHRETLFWDGSKFWPTDSQTIRDAMKLTHTDGSVSIDTQITNNGVLRR